MFERIAEVQEILDADTNCGACGSSLIKFRVRTVERFKYFELHCENCDAKLAFGQLRDGGGLFPKRTNDAGKMPNRGWTRYLKGSPEETPDRTQGQRTKANST